MLNNSSKKLILGYFLDKYNPAQFTILGANRGVNQDPNGVYGRSSMLRGKETFKRLFIQLIGGR